MILAENQTVLIQTNSLLAGEGGVEFHILGEFFLYREEILSGYVSEVHVSEFITQACEETNNICV